MAALSAAGLLSALRVRVRARGGGGGGGGGGRAAQLPASCFRSFLLSSSSSASLSPRCWLGRKASSSQPTLRRFSTPGVGSGGEGLNRRGAPGYADRNRGRGEGTRGGSGTGGGRGWGFKDEFGGGHRGNNNPGPHSSSSSQSPPGVPPRLRRPIRFDDPSGGQYLSSVPSSLGMDAAGQRRPHLVALLPGDYSDGPAAANDDWEDDEDDVDGDSDGEGGEPSSRLVEALRRNEMELQRKRERWIQNSIPPVWTSVVDPRCRSYGRGGRKRAQARVWVQPGYGTVTVNRRHFEDYFVRMSDRDLCLQPMVATSTLGHFDVTAIVRGGGLTGQAGAIRHGLARALNAFDPDRYRPDLKALGLLTRDARKVERKKIGHKKARKSPQWVRR